MEFLAIIVLVVMAGLIYRKRTGINLFASLNVSKHISISKYANEMSDILIAKLTFLVFSFFGFWAAYVVNSNGGVCKKQTINLENNSVLYWVLVCIPLVAPCGFLWFAVTLKEKDAVNTNEGVETRKQYYLRFGVLLLICFVLLGLDNYYC